MKHTSLAPYGSVHALALVAKVGDGKVAAPKTNLLPYGSKQSLAVAAKVGNGKDNITQQPAKRQVIRRKAA